MKVGLVTGWAERCGLTECSKNIIRNVPGVEFKVIEEPYDQAMLDGTRDCDIVHIAYEFNVVHISPEGIKALNKPVVMTYFTSLPENNLSALTDACDRIVVLEPTKDTDSRFVYIPMAIPEGYVATQEPENLVGTIGFPFPWKKMPEIARAAQMAGMGYLGIMPSHPWMDTPNCIKQQIECRQVNQHAEVFTEWLSIEEVMKQLGRCKVVCFAHRENDQTWGISSSTRYGLATGRPIVMTRFTMYRDLFPYEDEIHFVDMGVNTEQLADALKTAEVKPKRVLQDFSWKTAGEKYLDIYNELFKQKEKVA